MSARAIATIWRSPPERAGSLARRSVSRGEPHRVAPLAEAAGLEVEPHLEVLLDGEAVEHVVPLGHVADARSTRSSWAGRFVTGSCAARPSPSRTGTNPKSALMSV